uniref:Glycerophosphocholine phosphodiesterase n=1 Tax=Macrostomum lignano TaxID=282301 RepID=A0A1I8I761_9PLAT
MSADPLAPPSDGSQMLLMGHRGVGTCQEQELHRRRCSELGLPLPDRIRENTLRSMLATHAAGGHFVEFDVQLSKDRVPIIHHNFYTDDGRFVGNLTLAELQAINEEDGCGPDEHQYSTLESFFRLLPDELGFDIEIKYPRQYKTGASLCPEFHWDLMDYVSTIVDSVRLLSNGSRRRIFYSCFVSDVCLALRRLHPEYPTVFLLNHKEGHKYTEVHGLNGRSGLKFAASAKLQGVAIRSEELQPPKVESMEDGRNVTEPGREFIIDCKRRKLRCLTWGPANNSSEFRRLQRDYYDCRTYSTSSSDDRCVKYYDCPTYSTSSRDHGSVKYYDCRTYSTSSRDHGSVKYYDCPTYSTSSRDHGSVKYYDCRTYSTSSRDL